MSIFNNHDVDHPLKPVDLSTLPSISGVKYQPPAPTAPAVKKPTDFGLLRPAGASADAPKVPAGLPAAPVPIDVPPTKSE